MRTIPKVIHYCWFGGNPLGEKELACIQSWRRYLPDYEIKQWDETNWNVNCCDYVAEAYEAKKWAFVSDYARFDILYRYGGLYFDTDVEIIKPIDDIIAAGPFMGFETDCPGSGNNARTGQANKATVAAGLGLSANPGLGLYKTILDSYKDDHFVNDDGSYDQTSVVYRVTGLLRDLGLRDMPGIQTVAGITIYPSEYFNPKSYLTGAVSLTRNTRSVHHFSMSWLTDKEIAEYDIGTWLRAHHVPGRVASNLAALVITFRYCDFKRVLHKLRKGK